MRRQEFIDKYQDTFKNGSINDFLFILDEFDTNFHKKNVGRNSGIFIDRFLLDKPKSLRQLAIRFNVSRTRIHQIEKNLMERYILHLANEEIRNDPEA
jgi:hypothetical protein